VTDRQARDLPLDAHLHTDLSPDSSVPIDTYAAAAVERGIAERVMTKNQRRRERHRERRRRGRLGY
jgi:histidinol phosphatase-like PHP family hydrolase